MVAVLSFRNEAAYLANVLRHFTNNDIYFALIDHGSEDDSRMIALDAEFSSHLIDIRDLPFHGLFDLTEQLMAKAGFIDDIDADWIIHCDADEIMHSYRVGETLHAAISRIDQAGFNVIDFNEFVFLPVSSDYEPDIAGPQNILSYYFFEPFSPRLMRAWKKSGGFEFVQHAGHLLDGPGMKLVQEKLALRHYLFRNQNHAFSKYAERKFSERDLSTGWHGNRINQPISRFQFPPPVQLHWLADSSDLNLRTDRPRKLHYWQW